MKILSLRTRLILIFTILILLSWVISSAIGYVKVRHRIRLAYDAEQIMFAKRLERSGLDDLLTIQAKNNNTSFRPDQFKQARDALSFAIFTTDGKKLLTDRDDVPDFFYSPTDTKLGETPEFRESKLWRVLWLKSQDQRFIIAVGQKNAYRERLAKSILLDHQVTPWGTMIPIMLIIITLMINRELAPLKRVTSELKLRKPDDETPIEEKNLPPEVQPFVDALNLLFNRIGDMLKRERRFVSDAAHELRSPLTALRVQTEVAQLTVNKPEVQKRALNNLTIGIDRASRLVDQLLTLSRLDAQSGIPEQQVINWQQLIQDMQPAFFASAKEQQINLQINYQGMPPDRQGNEVLLSLLVRNLVDNALHYTPTEGSVSVTLTEQQLIIEDSGPGVTEEHLQRLGERFYRPPGQTKIGSGLGISIVKQIAELHGLEINFANRAEGGFSVRVGF
ncbi:two-component system sensor histidine kinase QseC [Budviciaceae bacterium CWB-B4]|uniref:Sensor protein QseC n=1 Tax=Limnobaculum xujianqingii TaxID=2738837 RepID=A0A9D7FXQ4_9GAMM|nr:quorum sensing histidine kinase QseC [Limnobaculum xujianqingii]MBK5073052.1 two-component system sensor histidine kinase QseC [Limnobaculum xujianqingii]MBK5176361.1 two-component system sensor histidine kinase QseC [Limnobaculum xujianqingii]